MTTSKERKYNREYAKRYRKSPAGIRYYKKYYNSDANRRRRNRAIKRYHNSPGGKKYVRKFLLKKYGLTIAQRNKMLREQHGRCYICKKPEILIKKGEVQRLCIDHDHKTGKVRGVLCHKCNSGLGFFNDDPVLLAKAISFFKKV